ncbi:MAG: hypothetical protein QNL04_02280 [SAR324 cluster bacterium]|nr:hypothetical protein [SAR324 cluster bacterium]
MFGVGLKKVLIPFILGLLVVFGCAPETPESASFGASASEPTVSTKTLTISDTASDSTVISWTAATNNGAEDTSFTYQVYYTPHQQIFTT